MHSKEWNVSGMTCNSCAKNVETAIKKHGVKVLSIDYFKGKVCIESSSDEQELKAAQSVKALGYGVNVDLSNTSFTWNLKSKLLICLAFTIPLWLHMFIHWPILHNPYFQLLMSLPVYGIGMWYFGKSAILALWQGMSNMDVLIVLGASASMIYSLINHFYLQSHLPHPEVFYESAATIFTLVFAGNYLEERALAKTQEELKQFQEHKEVQIRKITINESGKEQIDIISEQDLQVNDSLLLNEGDGLAADGILYFGSCTVSEAFLTGEFMPIQKNIGDTLLKGSTISSGWGKLRVSKVGKATSFDTIMNQIDAATQNKPKIQNFNDRLISYFTPVVLGISILFFIINYYFLKQSFSISMMRSVAILVVSCPCALGLATPAAVFVALGKAAKNGIFVKKASVFENMNHVSQMIFDKTGTLTLGQFSEVSYHNSGIISDAEARNIMYQMQLHSTHPLATSIISLYKSWNTNTIEFASIEAIHGAGIKAIDNKGDRYFLGKLKDSKYAVNLLKNDVLVFQLEMDDTLKADAKQSIDLLYQHGIEPILLSGDSVARTQKAAEALGIKTYYGAKTPSEKLAMVQDFTKKGITAMVGDGINDVLALSSSHISCSFTNASNAAKNSADVIILGHQMTKLNDLKQLSEKTYSNIRQNIIWAFSYNIIALPLAGLGLFGPSFAALLMGLSDLVIFANALRLKLYNPKKS